MPKNQHIIKRIEDIEQQLRELKLELSTEEPGKKTSKKLVVGEEVKILNPKKGQGTEGRIIRINYATRRATVETTKGNISRIFSNLKHIQRTSNA